MNTKIMLTGSHLIWRPPERNQRQKTTENDTWDGVQQDIYKFHSVLRKCTSPEWRQK